MTTCGAFFNRFIGRIVLAVLVCGVLMPASASAEVVWTIAPYLWSTDITRRADINEADAFDKTYSSLLDETNFAGMGFIDVRSGRYGAFADIAFLNLGDQDEDLEFAVPAQGPVVFPDAIVTDAKFTFLDAVGYYRPGGGDEGLDVYLGVRMADVDQKFDVQYPGNVSDRVFQVDENYLNGIAGIRYSKAFSDKWDFSGRADAGAGDAEFTWNAQATAGYWFGDSKVAQLRFGYRYMEMKFETDLEEVDVNIDSKLEVSGPLVGVLFQF